MSELKVGSKARISKFDDAHGSGYTEAGVSKRNRVMPRLVGHDVCIIDLSDAHGLTYRVVKLNYDGWRGREEEILSCWVEPEEIEAVQ